MAGSFNHVTLVGRVVRDPGSRELEGGVGLTNFVLAVDRPFAKKSEKSDKTDFIPVVAWRKLAEICGEFLRKGRLILVEGRLQLRSFEKNGVNHQGAEIVASNVQLLDWPKLEKVDEEE
jgi:single-strand DNA-binding protein